MRLANSHNHLLVRLHSLTLFLAMLNAAVLFGAESPQKGEVLSASKSAADREWDQIKSLGRGVALTGAGTDKTSPSIQQRRANEAAALLQQANQFRDFRNRNPEHPAVKQAKQKEALALIWSAQMGGTTEEQRRIQLVAEVRQDPDMPAVLKYEVSAWSKQLAVKKVQSANRKSFLATQASIARELIAEFPGLLGGYESLLAVARDSESSAAQGILNELEKMSAPPTVSAEVVFQKERFAMVGRSLPSLLGLADEVLLISPTRNKPVVIYAWSQKIPSSGSLPVVLSGRYPEVFFLGVCLDPDSPAVRAFAVASKLPGTQRFTPSGTAGRFAELLHFKRPGDMLLADTTGIIRDVNGADNPFEKFAALFRR